MGIAPQGGMAVAKKFIEDIEEYARTYPDQESFVKRLLEAVERIQCEFEGEVRDALLREARSTLEQQKSIREHTARALAALKELRKNQERLLQSLLRATTLRPPGVTIH